MNCRAWSKETSVPLAEVIASQSEACISISATVAVRTTHEPPVSCLMSIDHVGSWPTIMTRSQSPAYRSTTSRAPLGDVPYRSSSRIRRDGHPPVIRASSAVALARTAVDEMTSPGMVPRSRMTSPIRSADRIPLLARGLAWSLWASVSQSDLPWRMIIRFLMGPSYLCRGGATSATGLWRRWSERRSTAEGPQVC